MAKKYLTVLGPLLLLIGILGFFDVFQSDDKLFGAFAVDTPHNLIYVAAGLVAALAMSMGEEASRMYTKIVGVVFALITIVGFLVGEGQIFGFIDNNQADNVFNLVVAATALYVGFGSEGKTARKAAV